MSNTYKINFKQLRQDNLKKVFDSFERALHSLNIDFYLIGAVARDTWFAQKGVRALGTKDIDWAVLVSDKNDYEKLREFLISREGFTKSSSNEYVLFDPNGHQIDLLPFGAIEIEGNKIVDSAGVVRTDISGFKEVYEGAVENVTFENKYRFKVASLPGIVVLKLIAFDDRPEMRIKDIQDIGLILNHYFEIESDHIYEHHSDLFEHTDQLELVAAHALGRDMRSILNQSKLLKQRILSILHENTKSADESKIGLILLNVLDQSPGSIESSMELLIEIKRGIEDK